MVPPAAASVVAPCGTAWPFAFLVRPLAASARFRAASLARTWVSVSSLASLAPRVARASGAREMHSAATVDTPAIGCAEALVTGRARPTTPRASVARTVMEREGMATFRSGRSLLARLGEGYGGEYLLQVRPGQRLGKGCPRSTGCRLLAAVLRRAQTLVDLLAGRADRKLVRVAPGHPDLAAERGDRLTGQRALEDLLLAHVVREALVVAGLGDLGQRLGALEHGRPRLALGFGGVGVVQRRHRLAHHAI